MKTACVIGAGIAGLSIAEILIRSGYNVTVIDSNSGVGGQASTATQKWFHTGWLYSQLKNLSSAYDCYHASLMYHRLYSRQFGEEVVNIDQLGSTWNTSPSISWFDPSNPVYYLFADSTKEIPWNIHLMGLYKLFRKFRTERFFRKLGYDFHKLPKNNQFKHLLNGFEDSPYGYKDYTVIHSTDCSINTSNIVKSLTSELTKAGAQFLTSVKPEVVERGGKTSVKINGLIYDYDEVVLSCGSSIPEYLKTLGKDEIATNIKSIKSPILVFDNPLWDESFIRFTPVVQHTVNHLKYRTNNGNYISTVGSYHYYPLDKEVDIGPFIDYCSSKLGFNPSTVVGHYFGIKTEYTGEKDRRYNHTLKRVNSNTHFALAGKFSQFPLLVAEIINDLNLRPKSYNVPNEYGTRVSILNTEAETILLNHNKKKHGTLLSH